MYLQSFNNMTQGAQQRVRWEEDILIDAPGSHNVNRRGSAAKVGVWDSLGCQTVTY
jgi:hypothetical protein